MKVVTCIVACTGKSASELEGAGALRGAHAGSALTLPGTAFPTTLAIKLRSAAPARVGGEGAVVQPGAVWVRASAARTFRPVSYTHLTLPTILLV